MADCAGHRASSRLEPCGDNTSVSTKPSGGHGGCFSECNRPTRELMNRRIGEYRLQAGDSSVPCEEKKRSRPIQRSSFAVECESKSLDEASVK